jgi:hypothetical protein
MRWPTAAVLGVVFVLLSAGAANGSVTPAAVTVDDPNPELQTNGDGWKVTVGVTNVTDDPVTLEVRSTQPQAGATCKVMFGKNPSARLDPATHADVDVTYPAGCDVGDSGVAFTLTPDVQPAPKNPIDITATAKEQTNVNWGVLWWFLYGMAGAAVLLFFACFFIPDVQVRPWTRLDRLPATWSFSDSWVSTITVLGGVLTSVVGSSDTVKAILGDDADTALARATVGAAIAAAIIALGAVVLQVFKWKGSFNVLGLFLAGAIVVGAAFGELYVVWKTAEKLALDGLEKDLEIPFLIVTVLLAVYAMRNLRSTIAAGLTEPEAAVSDTAIVASALVGALERDVHDPKDLLDAVKAAKPEAAVSDTAIVASALVGALERDVHDPKDLLDAVKAAFEQAGKTKPAAGAVVVPAPAVGAAPTIMTTVRQRPMHAALL